MEILHIDIESSPNTAHVWGLFKQNISLNQLMESSYTMCYAAKWHGKGKVIFRMHKDKDFMQTIWDLLSRADAVTHWNGSRFDIPTLNKDFILAGYAPPDPFHQIDLLRISRQRFRFPSNKLDYVAQALGLGKKHEHEGHELWVKCMADDPKAWKIMERYNKQDVRLLEGVYNRFLPWIKTHPNHALYVEHNRPVCTNCGSEKVVKKGVETTTTMVYQRYRCKACGTPLRARVNCLSRFKRGGVLTQSKL